MSTITTMEGLYSYLLNTSYDISIIMLTYTFTPKINYIQKLIAAYYNELNQNAIKKKLTYTLTYEYIMISSPEIINFYLTNITTNIPYLVTYKKSYITIRNPWWYPCKQIDANAPIDDINVFIKYSLI